MLATDRQLAEGVRPRERRETEPWPAPRPLATALTEVLPLDPELLPETLRLWVMELAERLQVLADYPAAAAIVMLTGAVSRRASIRPKRQDHWVVAAKGIRYPDGARRAAEIHIETGDFEVYGGRSDRACPAERRSGPSLHLAS